MANQTEQFDKPVENGLKNYFSLNLSLLSEDFFSGIIERLAVEQDLKRLKVRAWAAMGFFCLALTLLAFALNQSFIAFTQSATFNFLSLMVTDFRVVVNNWQDYTFGVLETLPLGALAFMLTSLLAAVVLAQYSLRQIGKLRKLSHLHLKH